MSLSTEKSKLPKEKSLLISILDGLIHFLDNSYKLFGIAIGMALVPFLILRGVQKCLPIPIIFYLSTALSFIWFFIVLRFSVKKLDYLKKYYNNKFFIEDKFYFKFAPLALIITAGLLAAICFGALSSCLSDAEIIRFEPMPEKNNFNQQYKFYLWHALDLIPSLGINETFHKPVPLKYGEGQKGIAYLLLIFKFIIAWILISQIYKWLKWKEKEEDKEEEALNPETKILNS